MRHPDTDFIDRYPAQANQIYRLGVRIDQNGGTADYPNVDAAVGEGVKENSSLVIASTRIRPDNGSFLRKGDKLFKERPRPLRCARQRGWLPTPPSAGPAPIGTLSAILP